MARRASILDCSRRSGHNTSSQQKSRPAGELLAESARSSVGATFSEMGDALPNGQSVPLLLLFHLLVALPAAFVAELPAASSELFLEVALAAPVAFD